MIKWKKFEGENISEDFCYVVYSYNGHISFANRKDNKWLSFMKGEELADITHYSKVNLPGDNE